MTTAADLFKLAVGPWTESVPNGDVGLFGTVSVESNFDAGTSISFGVSGGSPESALIAGYETDVWLYRDGTPAERCRVLPPDDDWAPNGEHARSVQSVDYKRLLNARYVQSSLSFEAEAQEQIVWALIQHTQAQPGGDLGITAGTLGSSTVRDRTYEAGENIGKELDDLTKVVDGPWYGIDGLLRLNCFPASSFPVRSTPIQMGATARRMRRIPSSSGFANSAFVDGDGAVTVPVSVDSATVATDPRGRWEVAAGFPTVQLQETLVEKANGIIQELDAPAGQWDVEIEPSRFLRDANYEVGDFVELVHPKTGASVGVQIMHLSYSFSASGDLSVKVQGLEVPS